jgi:diguanylate cyclase (GGDEF)-like protein
MIDIDHFKEVNDKHGHKVGDKVLVEFANVIKENLRGSDIYARWGGEEFIVLMPETKIEQALKVAERLRKSVENYNFSEISKLTISIGVVQKPPLEMKIDEVIIRADNALYKAKNNGRNRVEKG